MDKPCDGCKKTLSLDCFTENDHVYTKCHECRLILIKRKHVCDVCGIHAIYNIQGETIGIRCGKHRTHEMVNVRIKKCIVCQLTIPFYGFKDDNIAKYCAKCKAPNMIDIRSKKCEVCHEKIARYQFEGKKSGTHCFTCKEDGMIDVASQKCVICNKKARTFAKNGEARPTHCSSCKLENMKDVVTKKCATCKKTSAVFNIPGSKAMFCGRCKTEDMINVKQKLCIACNIIVPVFNFEGEKTATHCNSCKLKGMVDIKNRMCAGCKKKIPTYGYQTDRAATHCYNCKLEAMVSIKKRNCIKCKTVTALFNYEHDKVPLYCATCKESNMVDIIHRVCENEHCRKRASYGLPGTFVQCCATHKKPGMIENPRRLCVGNDQEDCKEFATHGVNKPLHCEEHATPDEYHLAERECLQCSKVDILNRQGICINFCSLEEKDAIMKKRVKKKEEYIRTLLAEKIDLKTHVIQSWEDQIIDASCSRRRPDFVYHCGAFVIIVEVDEDQHRSYVNCGYTPEEKKRGENRRMLEISQIFQGLPMVWIRYNPDAFKDKNNKPVKVTDKKRQELLIAWIKQAIQMTWASGIHVKYLFYDGFDPTHSAFSQITHQDAL